MSKYLIVGDIHLTESNIPKVQKLLNTIDGYGLKTVLLGDQLDRKGNVEIKCLNLLFNHIKNSPLEYIILVGNHDLATTNSILDGHSMESFKALKNVQVVDSPLVEGKCLFLPFTFNPDDFRRSVNACPGAEYLFCHQDFINFDFGNGHISEKGNTLEDIKQFKSVIVGHYHKYQAKDNLTYLGTPFSHSFGESNQDKYLGIFDTDNGSLELIKTDFPRHVTAEFHLDMDIYDKLDEYDHNRVILIGKQSDIDAFDRSKYPGVRFLESPRVTPSVRSIKETETPMNMFTKWYREIKKETDDSTYQLGLDIMKDIK